MTSMISHRLMHDSPCSWRTLRAKSTPKWPSSTTPGPTSPTKTRCTSVPVLGEAPINWLTLVISRPATSIEVRADKVVAAIVQWKGTSLPSLHLVWLNESSGLDGSLRHFLSLAISLASPFGFGSVLGSLTTLSHWDGPFT